MRLFASVLLSGASLAGLSAPAFAETASAAPEAAAPVQDDQADVVDNNEIIVEARRKSESLQDVPLTVNAVTAEDIGKLNIRRFEDIQTVVPGLALKNNANGIGATATVRGVNFDVNASGNNGTIEFYLNDSPISAGNLFQAMFDIGQVELLRGPQGTLRGRASPSGSMTATTKKADLSDWGGYITATGTSIGGINANAAVNLPIVEGMLAVRAAAIIDHNEGARVTSINNPVEPYSRTKGLRGSIRFDPTDNISITAMYQKLIQNIRSFGQVESANQVIPALPASPVTITARDRLSVTDRFSPIRQEFDNLNVQARWAFAGQVLNYAGAMNKQQFDSTGPLDTGDFFGPAFPANTKSYGQATASRAKAWAHELRLSSEERLFDGLLDYTLGVFQQKLNAPTDLVSRTLVFFGLPSPNTGSLIVNTPIQRRGGNKEQSAFANVNLHFGESTELSGGVRYIRYKANGTLAINGNIVPAATENVKFNAWIYSASLKHEFSDDLMVYANTGSSWRPGLSATGDFSLSRSALEQSFVVLPPEKSTSYEIGFKASALDKRLRLNMSAYYQKFTNYPYRSPSGVFYVEENLPGQFRRNVFNFVAAVPVTVKGVEAEVAFNPTPDWDISANVAFADGKIKNGVIPCNDYFPRDGNPDTGSQQPTLADLNAVFGAPGPTSERISACTVTQRAALSAPWSGNIQSEYRVPISSATNGFVRGLVTWYGNSQNDPTNSVDDVEAYALANLYAGIRDPNGAWEVSLYGKNVTNTGRVLTRSSTPLSTGYQIGPTAAVGVSSYYGITYTAPREFGLNVRFAWGSR